MNRFFAIFLLLCFTATVLQSSEPRKNAIRTTFLSFATGSAKLSYERSLTYRHSAEITGGVIGWGFDGQGNRPRGGLLRYAHKFFLNSKPAFPMDGFYLKPEFALSNFNYDQQNGAGRKKSTMGALMACGGYQWTRRLLSIDGFVGAGAAGGNEVDTYYEHGFILWDFFGTQRKNIALTFGVKVGVAF